MSTLDNHTYENSFGQRYHHFPTQPTRFRRKSRVRVAKTSQEFLLQGWLVYIIDIFMITWKFFLLPKKAYYCFWFIIFV